MGLVFTASYWGDKFQVEVTHDGDLVFLDYNAEVAWQLRRFIDVTEALERGEDWPPIEATP